MTPDPLDHERRISRLEAWTDDRLVTKDVFKVTMEGIVDRLEKSEDNDRWLIRFTIMALVGVVVNIVVVLITTLGR